MLNVVIIKCFILSIQINYLYLQNKTLKFKPMRAILIHKDGQQTQVEVTLRLPITREQIIESIKTNMNNSGLINKIVKVTLQ